MANEIDDLLNAYEKVVNEPWSLGLSGQERIWFLVYAPEKQRKVDFRLDDFETVTKKAGKKWVSVSFKKCFPSWMAAHEYKEGYFADPGSLVDQLESEFKNYAIEYIQAELQNYSVDDNTLIAFRDVSSLFGFARLSDVLNTISNLVKGRMLIFFPGEFDKNQFRLLDARDGWSYLARPITA